jgi:ABC-type amino acid transport substrate-binding protein
MLANGEIDILIRSATHTTSREEFADWSINYFVSGPRLAVLADTGITGLNDLSGQYVAILAGTTNELQLSRAAEALGVEYIPLLFESSDAACDALFSGVVDALLGDWLSLLACTYDDPDFPVVGELLSVYTADAGILGGEPFGIAVPLGNADFVAEIDAALLSIIFDGTWQDSYDFWFIDPPPWTLEQMLNEPPAAR